MAMLFSKNSNAYNKKKAMLITKIVFFMAKIVKIYMLVTMLIEIYNNYSKDI